MEKVGRTGHSAGYGRGDGYSRGRVSSIVLHSATAAGALLILVLTMFSTTDRSRPDGPTGYLATPGQVPFPSSRVALMLPGHSLVQESAGPMASLGVVELPSDGRSGGGEAGRKLPLSPEEMWPGAKDLADLADGTTSQGGDGADPLRQISIRSTPSVEQPAGSSPAKDERPVNREPIPFPGALWVLATGILVLLSLRKKYLS